VKDFFRNNGLLILTAAVLLALVTAVCSILFGGFADPLSNLAGILATPVRNGISAFANWTGERYSDAFEREQLKTENEELKQRIAQLEETAPPGGRRSSGKRAPAQPPGPAAQQTGV